MSDITKAKTASDTVPPQAGEASTAVPGQCLPMGYPQGYYGHYSPTGVPTTNKPADGVQVCPPGPQPYFIGSGPHVPPHLHPIQADNDGDHGYATQSFYQHTLLPPMPYHPTPYPIIRPDSTPVHVPGSYPIYPLTVYPKQTVGGQTELVHGPRNPNDRPGLVSKPG